MTDDLTKSRRRIDVTFSEKDITQDGVSNKVPVISEFSIKNLESLRDGQNSTLNNKFSGQEFKLELGAEGNLVYKQYNDGKASGAELTVKEAMKLFKEQSDGVMVTENGKYNRGATDVKIDQALDNTPKYVNSTNKALDIFADKKREPTDPDLKEEVKNLLRKNLLPGKEADLLTTRER